MEHTKSLGNQMTKPVKCIYYAVTLFGNAIWNKIPSRHLRKWFYQILGAKMGKNTFPCRRVEILLPQGLKLGDGVAVGWFAELDARGGITVDHDTNISSHVKMITGFPFKQPTIILLKPIFFNSLIATSNNALPCIGVIFHRIFI